MTTLLSPRKRACLATAVLALVASQIQSCSSASPEKSLGIGGSPPEAGGTTSGGAGQVPTGGASAGGQGSGGSSSTGGTATGGAATGGAAVGGDATGGVSSGGTDTGGAATGGSASGQYAVAMIQSAKAQAEDLTQSDVADLVTNAVTQAGGLDFIQDGQTVVLKPNLVSAYTDIFQSVAPQTANGLATDWRVVKAVADLVRAKDPTGQILVMEGSTIPTATAYSLLGYTQANFGSSVDQFIAIEGASCGERSTTALAQRTANGKTFWVHQQYVSADVVISIPVMKTHGGAGITGGVKNLGIGATPVGQYSAPPASSTTTDCTRGKTSTYIDHSTPETLGQFIHDYYSIRPPDFVVMDALQGLQHGPNPVWDDSGSYTYSASKMNMRLILAGKNAVAVDTVEALVMKCDPTKVPHLTKLAADGLGTTDITQITVVGNQISDVAKPFACKQTAICPGR
jgi:uncharacterized protein (DUF362 family)